jgi:hypothetical protein
VVYIKKIEFWTQSYTLINMPKSLTANSIRSFEIRD